ncbi:MAG: RecQ family ATP-dependent DNA helicase, partial [Salibacteraceae bacterium]|nr:RecQ family ATP-dependent DNA helicase [Salibacteraceae bacterium]
MNATDVLKQYWGFDAFRPLQEDIVNYVVSGKDALALLPTGGGKSICFQVPAMMMDGICIVVSPLIALMKDQVDNLKKRGIAAMCITSDYGHREIDNMFDRCIYDKIKFLYLSPERLLTDMAKMRIAKMKVNLIAVDEAHCISEWGYDFRPPYLQIAEIRALHPKVPILALTASATPTVVNDIQEKLAFKKKKVFAKSFKRDNLAYFVVWDENKIQKAAQIIQKRNGSGIIYMRSRKGTERIARELNKLGISA